MYQKCPNLEVDFNETNRFFFASAPPSPAHAVYVKFAIRPCHGHGVQRLR